jgi:hypothetical protein
MRCSILSLLLVLASTTSFVPREAAAQPSAVQVTGAEIEAWFAADQMAVAGINVINGCHWINKGPGTARSQTVYCPNSQPFTVTGEARVDGNRLCSKFTYPDGSRYEGCQEIFKVGENKYEARLNGATRTLFYRLVR